MDWKRFSLDKNYFRNYLSITIDSFEPNLLLTENSGVSWGEEAEQCEHGQNVAGQGDVKHVEERFSDDMQAIGCINKCAQNIAICILIGIFN